MPMCRNSAPCRCVEYSLSDRTSILRTLVVRAASRVSCQGYACPTRLLHRLLRRNCCRGLLVRVEKLHGDLELAVPSEDSVVLGMDRK